MCKLEAVPIFTGFALLGRVKRRRRAKTIAGKTDSGSVRIVYRSRLTRINRRDSFVSLAANCQRVLPDEDRRGR